MADPDFRHLDAELARLLGAEAVASRAPTQSEASAAPALLIRRAKDLTEPLLGKRARFLMTSYTPDGEWLAHGWKDGLRVVSEPVTNVAPIEEPAVWIQEERDYYGDLATAGRFAIGISRLWIEQYVSSTGQPDAVLATLWLENLNRNPNLPELRHLLPIQGHPDPVGARVVLTGKSLETDLRAVSPVRMTDNGELAVTVIGERDWYRWARDYPTGPHPTLRWEHAAQVWVE